MRETLKNRLNEIAILGCLVLGIAIGGGVGQAACDARCEGNFYWTEKTSATDSTHYNYKLNDQLPNELNCTQMFQSNTMFTTISGTSHLRKCRRIVSGSCSDVCYASGGVIGKISCSSASVGATEYDVSCQTSCGL